MLLPMDRILGLIQFKNISRLCCRKREAFLAVRGSGLTSEWSWLQIQHCYFLMNQLGIVFMLTGVSAASSSTFPHNFRHKARSGVPGCQPSSQGWNAAKKSTGYPTFQCSCSGRCPPKKCTLTLLSSMGLDLPFYSAKREHIKNATRL